MATVSGKAMWASILQPNTTFEPMYTINLVIDSDTADDLSSKGYRVQNKPVSWSDEELPTVVIKRKVQGPGFTRAAPDLVSNTRDPITGKWIPLLHLKIIQTKFGGDIEKYASAVNNDGYDIEKDASSMNINVGNGSDVTVQYKEWESKQRGQVFKGMDLQKVQVTKLVEYEAPDNDEFV